MGGQSQTGPKGFACAAIPRPKQPVATVRQSAGPLNARVVFFQEL